jgi:hypothetical protein
LFFGHPFCFFFLCGVDPRLDFGVCLGARFGFFFLADAFAFGFDLGGLIALVLVDARGDRQCEVAERLDDKLSQVGKQQTVIVGVLFSAYP